MASKTDNPTRRQLYVLLTDDEWRQLRIGAAERDTTIQGYATNVILRALQRDGKQRANAAKSG
jgi:hypothetical protein